jgi:hypothetical protein
VLARFRFQIAQADGNPNAQRRGDFVISVIRHKFSQFFCQKKGENPDHILDEPLGARAPVPSSASYDAQRAAMNENVGHGLRRHKLVKRHRMSFDKNKRVVRIGRH